MKTISKQNEPQEFIDWKGQANDEWQPSYDQLSGTVKKAVKESLIAEQGEICCYCERRLDENDSHIEHFQPQGSFPELALDYGNMLASCQQVTAHGEPLHCGNSKGDWYEATLTVSPLSGDCEKRFNYKADGRIEAQSSDDEGAQMSIKKMGLDIRKLNALRHGAIDPF